MVDDTKNDSLLEIITGNSKATTFTHKQANLDRHIESTYQEFIGQPKVNAEIMRNIVYLRRNRDTAKASKRLVELLDNHIKTVCSTMRTRWLLSVVDTYIQIGNKDEAAAATAISAFVNMCIMLDSALFYLDIDNFSLVKPSQHGVTNYGCSYFRFCAGDNVRLTISRIGKLTSCNKHLDTVWNEILHRLKTTENTMSDMAKVQEKKNFWK